MTNQDKLINTPEEAIECIKKNRPTSGYQMLNEALDMAITALEKQEPVQIRKFGDGTSKCPICRNWIKEDMDFCDKCGQAISWRADDEPYR